MILWKDLGCWIKAHNLFHWTIYKKRELGKNELECVDWRWLTDYSKKKNTSFNLDIRAIETLHTHFKR